MNTFVCKICGEVYIGREKPETCPFCGVPNGFLLDASVWKDENNIELSDISRTNIEKALEIELSNTAFYKCIAKTSKNIEVAKTFKGLAKVELEHAEVFAKLLKKDFEEIKEDCALSEKEIFENSKARETRAVEFYKKAMQEATEPRVKEVFGAIMLTEKDHLELDEKHLKELNS